LESDYRVRGDAISDGKPAALLSLSYDHPSGFYVNGSVIGSLDHENDAVLLGGIGNIGYARRIAPRISIDAGYARTQYSHYGAPVHHDAHYDEFYAGIFAHGLSAQVYVSPDYLERGFSTFYGELNAAIRPADKWRLTGHIGVLRYLSEPRYLSLPARYDWRIGAARQIGRFDLHVALTGSGPGIDRYWDHRYHRTAVIGGVIWSF
jgi:uncharacterized protein (TIGR02001 family)